mmetsp:Transcript_70823/g.134990  ORF Transcript_70823/g.134990 Transcript_70823/m.134990 type:complete len:536 (+) Transcript_70823:53-1660(+)
MSFLTDGILPSISPSDAAVESPAKPASPTAPVEEASPGDTLHLPKLHTTEDVDQSPSQTDAEQQPEPHTTEDRHQEGEKRPLLHCKTTDLLASFEAELLGKDREIEDGPQDGDQPPASASSSQLPKDQDEAPSPGDTLMLPKLQEQDQDASPSFAQTLKLPKLQQDQNQQLPSPRRVHSKVKAAVALNPMLAIDLKMHSKDERKRSLKKTPRKGLASPRQLPTLHTAEEDLGQEADSGAKFQLDIGFTSGTGLTRSFKLRARPEWTAQEIKDALARLSGIPAREQRLYDGWSELQNSVSIDMMAPDDCLKLRLKRRHPEHVRWTGRVAGRGSLLSAANSSVRKDREVALAAVGNFGRALQFVADDLKKDREVVLAAVRNDGYALRWAAPQLKHDKEIVCEAVSQNGLALHFASQELTKDKDLVLTAAGQNGMALQFAPDALRGEPRARELANTTGALERLKRGRRRRQRMFEVADTNDGRWPTCSEWNSRCTTMSPCFTMSPRAISRALIEDELEPGQLDADPGNVGSPKDIQLS